MNRYRLKINSSRTVGPFNKDQVGELYLRNHIDLSSECQAFPGGTWGVVSDFDELQELINNIDAGNVSIDELDAQESKTVVKMSLSQLKKSHQNEDDNDFPIDEDDVGVKEFQFSVEQSDDQVNYDELEKKYKDYDGKNPVANKPEVKSDRLGKTVLVDVRSLNEDKTVLNQKSLKALEDEKHKEDEEEQEPEVEDEKDLDLFDSNEKTEMVDISSVLHEKSYEIVETERELDRHALELEKEKADFTSSYEITRTEMIKKKAMRPIIAFAILAIIAVILFDNEDSEKEKIVPVQTIVTFPTADYLDVSESDQAYKKGVKLYKKGSYVAKVEAAAEFSKSLAFNFSDNPALGWIIRTYAEIYPNILEKDKIRSGTNFFKLMKIGSHKVLKDPNVALGNAIFFDYIGKHKTAQNYIENYLRLSKPTMYMMGIYLRILINTDDLIMARKVYKKLDAIKNVSDEVRFEMVNYLEVDERPAVAKKMLLEICSRNDKKVRYLLEYMKYLFRDSEYKDFKKLLRAVKILKAGRSPLYYSKYLEYLGLWSIGRGKPEHGAKLLKSALAIHESDALRSKLASLDVGGGNASENLISESKTVTLMRRARIEMKKKHWENAFSLAIEAADIDDKYIPAQLLLAEVQTKRGYFDSSIKTLTRLHKEYPLSGKVMYRLIIAYIDAYKLEEAKLLLNNAGSTKFRFTADYASALAKYNLKEKRVILSISYLQSAINKNPLDDRNYFDLAKIFLKNRKYKEARKLLNDAIGMDPLNIEYRSLYGDILFEYDGAEVAIGYLRELLEGHPDHPLIIGNIATYYYRSNQQKNFKLYQKRLSKLSSTDPSFYLFMIESAKRNDRTEDVIKYSRELIAQNPGELKISMTLGRYFLRMGNLIEAMIIFEKVKERLPSFPKINFYIGKIHMLEGKLDKAMKLAEEEIKSNKTLEFGYYLKGSVLQKQEHYTKAMKEYEISLSFNTKYFDALMALAWIKYKNMRYEVARVLYERAKKINGFNPEVYKELGQTYQKIGQGKIAIKHYNNYIKLKPNANDRSYIEGLINTLK